jgi:hypothetical protein
VIARRPAGLTAMLDEIDVESPEADPLERAYAQWPR